MLRLLLICVSAFMFVSCLDCHEEVWLNADGSGKARIQVNIPSQAARIHGGENGVKKLVTEYLEETPAFSSFRVAVSTKKDRLHIDVDLTFENALDLSETTTSPSFDKLPAAARDLAGHTDVKFEGMNILFHRKIDLTRAIPGSVLIPQDQLKDYSIETILHLPKAATEHNADSASDGGKTLTWKTPMARALREPLHQTFQMPLPLPWTKIIVWTVGGLAVLVLLVRYVRSGNRRRRR